MNPTELTTESVTWQDDVATAASGVYDALIEVDAPILERPDRAAVVLAALRDEGWEGGPAMLVAGYVLDGVTAREAESAATAMKSVRDPWRTIGTYEVADLREASDADVRGAVTELRAVLRRHRHEGSSLPAPGGSRPQLGRRRTQPVWLVRDWVAYKKRHLYAGPHGSAKTATLVAMMAASLKGEQFLGRDVPTLRWMYLSGEQSRDEMNEALEAFGLTDDDLEGVHLTTREAGVALGESRWDSWLRSEADAFEPDVIVLDTAAMVCSGVEVASNDSVRDLFRDVLTPLVDEHDAALLVSHHVRKSSRTAGDEDVLGAVAWTNQSDQVIKLAPTSKLLRDGLDTSRRFAVRRTKGRRITEDGAEHYEVRGRLDDEGATVAMELLAPAVEPTISEQMIAALDSPLGRGALAEAVGLNDKGTAFRNALREAVEAGAITKNDDNLYERGES